MFLCFLLILLISCLYVYPIFYIASVLHIFCYVLYILLFLFMFNSALHDVRHTADHSCTILKKETQKTKTKNTKQRKKRHKETQQTQHNIPNKTEKHITFNASTSISSDIYSHITMAMISFYSRIIATLLFLGVIIIAVVIYFWV